MLKKYFLTIEQRKTILDALFRQIQGIRESMQKTTSPALLELAESGIQNHEMLIKLFEIQESER